MESSEDPASDDSEEPQREKLSWGQIFSFASPAVPISALGLPLVVYLPPFYAEATTLDLATVGTLFMVARFWDVFTDPILGVASDRLETRWGRRRHWIVASVPILLVGVYFIFMPPASAGAVYLMGWLGLLYVGWTLLTISHMSWGAELSPNYHERSKIQGWREVCLVGGMLMVLVLPAIIEGVFKGGSRDKVASMGWFIIILLPLTVALAVLRVPERPVPAPVKVGFWRSVKLVLSNKLMLRVLLADVLIGLGPGITGSTYVYFVKHVLKLGQHSSLLLLLYFFSGVIAIPAWIKLSYKLGKHRTLSIAMFFAGSIITFALFAPAGALWPYLIGNVIFGLGYGAGPFLLRSITADIADVDAVESGTERTGLFYSLLTMTNKVGFALSVGIAFVLLQAIGFDPKAETNSEESLFGLRLIFVLLPMVFFLSAGLLMWGFPLDEKAQRAVREKLGKRAVQPSSSASSETT